MANHRNDDPEKTLEVRSISHATSHTVDDSSIGPAKDATISSDDEISRPLPLSCNSTISDFESQSASLPLPAVPGYVIEGILGRGGMGVVYRARHIALNRPVALKMVLAGIHAGPDERSRFRTETEAVARLQHPNIVQIYEIGDANGHPYCSLEYLAGGTLADEMKSSALTPAKAARLVETLARAVQTAHDRKVIHRDLKPANILFTADGTPKIADFGLARQTDNDSGQTQSGAVMGSPSYMAPEQASGRSREAGPGVDIWALGAILYECLAGRPPFRGDSVVETLELVRSADPAPPSKIHPKVPVDLETICLKALAKDPSRRFATASELADDLQRFLNDEPILARRAGLAEKLWRRARRNTIVVGLTATVLALTAVVTVIALRPKSPPVPIVTASPETDFSSEELITVVAELDRTDPGWRLEQIQENREEIPDEENGALRISAFVKSVQKMTGNPYSIGNWENEEVLDSIKATYAGSPVARLTGTEDLARFRSELERMSRPLEIARSLQTFPKGRVPIKFKRNGITTLLPDHQTGRYMTNLLKLDALVQIEDGNRAAALMDCLAILNLGQVYAEDPIIIAQLVRNAVLRFGIQVAERIVCQLDCTAEEFETLQRVIDRASAAPAMLTAARGERGGIHDFMSAIEAGDVSQELLKETFGSERDVPLPSPMDARRLHVWALRYLTEFVAIAREPAETWLDSIRRLDERRPAPPVDGAEAIRDFTLGTSKSLADSAEGIMRSMAELRAAATAMAMERYRLAHGAWPADLGKLVPDFLTELPKDPYDGQPLRIRKTSDGVVIYSVGEDLNDNQGSLDRTFNKEKDGLDIGFSLAEKPKGPKATPK